jgi:hypothetical protein
VKTLVAALLVTIALAFAPGVLAAGGAGSLTVSATSVTSGNSFTATACVVTSGDGGYLIVKGPNTFSQDLFFGPAAPCSMFSVTTVGWPAGKYRINAFEFTAKGDKGIGSVTLTVV